MSQLTRSAVFIVACILVAGCASQGGAPREEPAHPGAPSAQGKHEDLAPRAGAVAPEPSPRAPPKDVLGDLAKSLNLEVRRSFRELQDYGKPARFQVRSEKDAQNSYSIDVGVKGRVLPFSADGPDLPLEAEVSLFAERHKNDLEGALEQNNLQVGPSLRCQVGDSALGVMFNAPFSYKWNKVKKTESVTGAMDALLMRSNWGLAVLQDLLPSAGEESSELRAGLFPRLGYELEDVSHAEKSKDEGRETRAYASIELLVEPWARTFDHRFQVGATWKQWRDLSESGPFLAGDRDHEIFTASARYFLDAGQHMSLGVEYSNGEIPALDLPNSEFWIFSLEVKF